MGPTRREDASIHGTSPAETQSGLLRGVLIHYSEIGLKGGNRPYFAGVLRQNIEHALRGLPHRGLHNLSGRLLLDLGPSTQAVPGLERDITARLSAVMGVAHFAFADRTGGLADRSLTQLLEVLEERVVALARARAATGIGIRSFAIRARRSDKRFPLTSTELNRRLGRAVQDAVPWPVDIQNADLVIHVDVVEGDCFIYTDRHPGPRGLPVGSSGRVMSLLSSGIDSPVASRRMMARGCRVFYAHFHSLPYTRRDSIELAAELVKLLTPSQPRSVLFIVPLAEIQQRIVTSSPAPFRVILYRRYMLRLAERLAQKVRARALVTGESLGQVASQTLENLAAIEQAVSLPVMRPLIAMSKEEIIAEARRIGTFETSIQPYDDCCSFLMPRQPETRARLEEVLAAEAMLGDMEELMRKALEETEERMVE